MLFVSKSHLVTLKQLSKSDLNLIKKKILEATVSGFEESTCWIYFEISLKWLSDFEMLCNTKLLGVLVSQRYIDFS